jgi:hypothetical protein
MVAWYLGYRHGLFTWNFSEQNNEIPVSWLYSETTISSFYVSFEPIKNPLDILGLYIVKMYIVHC